MKRIEVKPEEKFGKWTILKEVEQTKKWVRYFLVLCECGQEKTLLLQNLRGGSTMCRKCSSKMSIPKRINLGEKNGMWRGDSVKYSGLHMWVRHRLGKPSHCSSCGIQGKFIGVQSPRWNIHWANKSQKYLRDLTDWLALCGKCHLRYDNHPFVRNIIQ